MELLIKPGNTQPFVIPQKGTTQQCVCTRVCDISDSTASSRVVITSPTSPRFIQCGNAPLSPLQERQVRGSLCPSQRQRHHILTALWERGRPNQPFRRCRPTMWEIYCFSPGRLGLGPANRKAVPVVSGVTALSKSVLPPRRSLELAAGCDGAW